MTGLFFGDTLPFISIKTKTQTITMSSNKVAENIFIDLTTKVKAKMSAIESSFSPSSGSLECDAIKNLRKQKILVW